MTSPSASGALVANDRISLTVEPGEDPLPPRRERRRQVDADERPVRPLPAPTRARSCSTAPCSASAGPGDAIARRHRHGPPALHAGPGLHRRRERHARRRADRASAARSTSTPRASACVRSPPRFGFDVDPDALVEDLPVGVQQRVEIIKALSRDAQGAHPRRAHRGADAAGDRRADGHHAPAHEPGRRSSSSPTSSREVREVADTHHGHPARQGRRRGRAPTATSAELAAMMVGRAGRASTVREGTREPAPAPLDGQGTSRVIDDPSAAARRRRVASTIRRGEILADRRRPGQRPDRAHRGACSACRPRPRGSITARRRASSRAVGLQAGPRRRPRRSSPRTASDDGLVGEFSIAENLMLDRSHSAPVRQAGSRCSAAGRRPEFADETIEEFDVRAPGIDSRGRHAVRRQPAEGRLAASCSATLRAAGGRPADPWRRRAARSSSSTSGSSASATHGVPVVIVSHRARTRWSRSPTGSWCSTSGQAGRHRPAGTARDVLGLMMAGVSLDEAQ